MVRRSRSRRDRWQGSVMCCKLCPEWGRLDGTAVELQEEAVFTSTQTQYPIAVRSQTPAGARCLAPVDQGTAALRMRCLRQRHRRPRQLRRCEPGGLIEWAAYRR